ncbi:hypothetical protein BAUCODRAFT_151932 [Baudoinia panamericana UAMH 10762]|uniref:Uncharacterized protein n=1 Tax=Baudoinia panamericana (strain UAMH 10762) TaxID=717646 RepID=M2M4K9_BAUPA|nr:uncharacterized protein BAUCODRAFT_151932 [Baudoinia panamericana UAMH 10762]EMC91521.1 hypothetical protein BAUCODRAFT_151932 [Baudoinia panamericana UAMH 10762]
MQSINNMREKLKRKLSLHDKNPQFDDAQDIDDVDEETHGHLTRDMERAEASDEPHGKPGSFLNRLIMHGNKKTEEEISREQALNPGKEINPYKETYNENAKPLSGDTALRPGTTSNTVS